MVEFGNSLDPDKEFDVLRGILDFPMELLEGDEVTEDWEIGDAQCFGPIPSNILMELPIISNEDFDSPNVFPRPVAPIAGAPEQRKLAMVQESGSFPTERPISVLESSGSCSREKSLSIKSDNAIPALRRSKRVRYSGTDPELSTPKQTSNARKSKVSRKRLSVAMDLIRNFPENVDNSLNVSDPAHQIASDPPAALVKKCAHCQSSKTPLWREGPLGPKTLCNACGVRYRSGCLFPEYRPLASPTFVPSQHSNSHKKVAEMRNKAKRLKVETKVAPLSPHKEAKFEEPPIVPQMEAKVLELPSPELEIFPTDGAPEQKKLPLHTDISNSLIYPQITGAPNQKHVEQVQLAKHVETSTYISLLESSRSYLKFRSIYFKHAGAKPWVPPSPPYEKTSGEEKSFEMNAENDDKSLDSSDCALLQNGSNSSCPALVKEKKKCTHCLSTKTPQQRKGPLGPDTLCNACGQQYQARHLVPEFQLYASPTFVPVQHTKSLRKLGQMRTKHMQSTADIKVDGAPEQKQLPLHIDISNSLISPQITGAPEQKHVERMQLAKHVETSTHVSLLESSRSYLKFRSIYFEHAGAKPWVPPSPPYEKTSGDEKSFGMHVENDDKSLDCSDCALLQNGSNSSSPALVRKEKKCAHCQSTETPLWREGPLGPHTLCNACGKQYRAGLLVPEYRPAASPIFVPSQHSNYHTKLVKTRTKPMRSGADIKIDGASELAKHADTSSSLTHPQIVRTSEQKQVEQMHADTPSHGSLLESSRSYLKYRSKYVKHAGAKPCVPPSPCKKTSCEEKLFEVPFKNDNDNTHGALLQNASNPCPGIIKKCTHCQLTKTPRWRKGPLGPCTLCNACGLQYRVGCLVPESQPYATSTFVPAQHSKSMRKFVQMRTKPMQSTADKKIDGAPELAKHVDTSSSLIRPQIVGTPKRNHLLLHIDASNSLHSLQIDVAPEQKHVEQMHHDTSSHVRDNSGCASLQNASNPCPAPDKKCANYQSTKTLQWRKGPLGTPTLCNACGLQYRAGRLVPESQPYATPTFMPAQRSKSIRKLVQMRTKPMQPTADIEIAKKKCCAHCQTKTTPDWRKGRLGPSTLCSACGKQYGAGRLVPEYLPRQRFRLLHKDDAAQC